MPLFRDPFPTIQPKAFAITFVLLVAANVLFQLGSSLHLKWSEKPFWQAFLISMCFILPEYLFKTAAYRYGFARRFSQIEMMGLWTALSLALAIPMDYILPVENRDSRTYNGSGWNFLRELFS